MNKLKPLSDTAAKSAFEANIGLGKLRKARIADNLLIDGIIERANGSNPFPAGPVMVFPIVAYPPAGQPFGEVLEYVCRPFRYRLDTTDFRKQKRIALAFDDFELRSEDGWNVFNPKKILVVENLPQESLPCGLDSSTGVPSRSDFTKRRFAMRLSGARIGPIIRDYGDEGKLKFDVFMHHRPSYCAVAFEAAPAVVAIPKATG